MNPRALAACIRQANTIDITRRSPSYEVRLAKYADRGFEIYFPALERTRLNYSEVSFVFLLLFELSDAVLKLYDCNLVAYPKGLARLVVLELMREIPFHYHNIYNRNSLNGHSKKFQCHQSLDFKPVEERLAESNYDSCWIRIPYGPDWDAERVKKLVEKIVIFDNASQ